MTSTFSPGIPVCDHTNLPLRCPACNGEMKIVPVEDETGWTGDVKVQHASPSCDWVKEPANVLAWLHETLAQALNKEPAS